MRYFWGILFAVVLAAAFILTAVSPLLGWWLPRGVSTYSRDIDILYYGILAVTAFFFILTEAILVYNMCRWAADPARKPQFTHGHHRLEMLWTVVPGVILFLLAVVQINVWADIKYPTHMSKMVTDDPTQILPMEVTTRQWEFRIRYPSPEHLEEWADKANKERVVKEYQHRLPERRDDVFDVNRVHTWKGEKTVVFLRTRDVGHAFFVPVLRVKQDAMPGRTIPLWFEATESNTEKDKDEWTHKPGTEWDWDLVCTQYCGSRHSMMRGKVFVHPDKADFLAWLKTQQKEYTPPAPAQ